jgi:uncharacterized iron-regulated membrane protein
MAERRTWVWLHRWLGLNLGLWFALVGLTGSVLVFEDEVDALLNPHLLVEQGSGAHLLPHRILYRTADEFPAAHVERIRVPRVQGDVYRLLIRVAPHMRAESDRVEAMFSPVSGRLLGTREAETLGISRPYLLKTIYEFHRNVLLGNFGSNIVGLAGFLLLTSALTGLVMVWPRSRAGWRRVVWVKVRAGATRILYDVHRSWGAVLCALLILATVTGSTLVYVNYVRDIVSVVSQVAPFPVVPWRPNPIEDWPSFEEVAAKVNAAYPDRAVAEIHLPSRPTAGYLFYLRKPGDVHRLGDTLVWVHSGTGEILLERSSRNRSAGETLMHWLFPLHSGAAFGMAGKIAMCFTGLAPLLLMLTGLWVWARKRRAERVELDRRAKTRAFATAGRARAERS